MGSPARNSVRNFLFVKDRARAGIADGHHLIKSMRNALKNNGIIKVHIDYVKQKKLVSDEVKWSHIVRMYEFDRKNKLKIASHIKKRYLKIDMLSTTNTYLLKD